MQVPSKCATSEFLGGKNDGVPFASQHTRTKTSCPSVKKSINPRQETDAFILSKLNLMLEGGVMRA